MRCVLPLLALALCACPDREPLQDTRYERYDVGGWTYVRVWHDDKRAVTCWVMAGTKSSALHCVPDWQLEAPK